MFWTDEIFFYEVEAGWDKEDREECGCEHAADDGRAKDLAAYGTGAGSKGKRHGAENESEGRHEDRAEAEFCSRERGLEEGLAFFVFVSRKLDDENGIFRGEADQHDEADLGVEVVLHSTK